MVSAHQGTSAAQVRRRPTVYLHVGGPKTGTTYLQEILWRNRDLLLHEGVVYPGRSKEAHFHSAQDLLHQSFNNYMDLKVPGAWQRLVDEVNGREDTIIISHELLGLASGEDVERALKALAFADVHIVYTVRDLARQIPSVWQEDLKNQHVLSFGEFVGGLRDGGAEAHWLVDLFWRFQSPSRVLELWAQEIPPERVHVITVPTRDSAAGVLWERFANTIGVDPNSCDTDVGCAGNRSLGVVEANLLRRMNPVLSAGLDWPSYARWVKGHLAGSVLGAREVSVPIELPESEHGWVLERSKQSIADLRDRGYDLVGDLAELLPLLPSRGEPLRHPDDASEAELLDAAADAVVGIVRDVGEFRGNLQRPVPPEPDPVTLIRLGLQRLSDEHRLLMRLRQLYRMGKLGSTRFRSRVRAWL